jgi:DNA-binding IclR family transcriptional regulator
MSLTQTLFPESRTAVLAALTDDGVEGLRLPDVARRTDLNSKTAMREPHSLRNVGVLLRVASLLPERSPPL